MTAQTPNKYAYLTKKYNQSPEPEPAPEETQESIIDEPKYQAMAQKAKENYRTPEQKKAEGYKKVREFSHDVGRVHAGAVKEFGSHVVGAYGDFQKFLKDIASPLEKAIPDPLNIIRDKLGIKSDDAQMPNLPTSADISGKIDQVTNGALKPKNEFEQGVQDFSGLFGSLMAPGLGVRNVGKALGLTAVHAGAKEGLEYAGLSKDNANMAGLGAMILTDILSRGRVLGGPRGFAEKELTLAENAIPRGTTIDAKAFERALQRQRAVFMKGGNNVNNAQAVARIDNWLGLIQNGRIDPSRFPAMRRAINAELDKLNAFQLPGIGESSSVRKGNVAALNRTKRLMINTAENWGRRNAPTFARHWRDGNQALTAYHQSNQIRNYLGKTLNKLIFKNPATAVVLGLQHGGIKTSIGLLGAKAGITAALTPVAIGARIIKSPLLRRYYYNTIIGALRGQSNAVVVNARKLDKGLSEEKKKSKNS